MDLRECYVKCCLSDDLQANAQASRHNFRSHRMPWETRLAPLAGHCTTRINYEYDAAKRF